MRVGEVGGGLWSTGVNVVIVTGLVSADVSTVRCEFAAREPLVVEPFRVPGEGQRFFVVVVPAAARPIRFVALHSNGTELGRAEIPKP